MEKPRLTVRPSKHGFVAQATRGGERWFSVSQEAPTREAAWTLAQQLAADAVARDAARP